MAAKKTGRSNCPHCGGDDTRKNGFTQAGAQIWRCNGCGKTHCEFNKQRVYGKKYPDAAARQRAFYRRRKAERLLQQSE